MNDKEKEVQIALGTVERCTACGELYSTNQLEVVQSTIDEKFYFICIKCLNNVSTIVNVRRCDGNGIHVRLKSEIL